LTSAEYAVDFEQVERFGRAHSAVRTNEQTIDALFWTDHDLRRWNEGMLRLAADRGLDFVPTARMLAQVTDTTREYARFHEAVKDVNRVRVLAGFHFRNSDQEGSNLGRQVARLVVGRLFQPLH
jgi:hypothetical protein